MDHEHVAQSETIFAFFKNLLTADFLPHGHCYWWRPEIVWLHVVSDSVIALAYYSIPLMLVYFVRKRRDIPFSWIFSLFGAFILACGTTHVLAIWTLWTPVYRLDGIVKAITAALSIGTAAALYPLIPRFLSLKSPAQLEVLNKELESFSYSVSHDLRAPLRAIDGYSLTLLEEHSDKLGAEGRHALDRIRAGCQRMGQLIDDLLSLSHISRAQLGLERIDLTALVKSLVVELPPQGRTAEFQIAEGVEARADARLVRIVLENLIGNAWKYTSKTPKPVIEFGSVVEDGKLAYFVRDNGAGFDMAYVDKLFGVFQRLHREDEFPGTGVGLATVQRIVSRHGGKVWAKGAVGQGAAFYFTLS